MSGISLTLESKSMKKLNKRNNAFVDSEDSDDDDDKKVKIRISEVEAFNDEQSKPQRIIVPSVPIIVSKEKLTNDISVAENPSSSSNYGLDRISGHEIKNEQRLVNPESIINIENISILPDSANQDDYDAVPVCEFGSALLRGMGWTGSNYDEEDITIGKESKMKSKRSFVSKNAVHSEFFGIGAASIIDGANISRSNMGINNFTPLTQVTSQEATTKNENNSRNQLLQ